MECPKKKKNVTKNQNFGFFLFQKTDWQIYDDKALWFVNNMKSRNQQVVFKHLPGNFYNFKYVLKINKV